MVKFINVLIQPFQNQVQTKIKNRVLALILLSIIVNCIPYTKPVTKTELIRIAIITGVDSVLISGIKDDIFYENYLVHSNTDLPIFFRPSKGKNVMVNHNQYYGSLEIKKINKKIWVINILNMEDYLKGVVPCEIGKISKNLIEVAKAQAIAARTYAFSHLRQYEELGFDLYATTRDQVYQGKQVEDAIINEAIIKTRGIILTYNGKPIDAKYHSTCGGRTADFNDAWKGTPVPYLRSVECGFCNESPHFAWQRQMSKNEFFKTLRKNLLNMGIMVADSELIKGFKLKRNPKSKRIVELKIITDRTEYVVSNYNIRILFGSENDPDGLLKSNNFTLQIKNDSIIIEGKGYGHGVGMCQSGAIGMAKKGKKFKEILKHYYPNTKLKKF